MTLMAARGDSGCGGCIQRHVTALENGLDSGCGGCIQPHDTALENGLDGGCGGCTELCFVAMVILLNCVLFALKSCLDSGLGDFSELGLSARVCTVPVEQVLAASLGD